MSRRVVFAGGIQARALAKAYRLDIVADSDEAVFFIGAEALAREAAHRVIAAADVVVTDLTAAGETVPDHLIPGSAERIAVPVISGAFLWPFAGRPHPRNQGIDALAAGPYPAEFGDSFLDTMLAERVPEDEAIRRYLDVDISHVAGLDARLEASLAALAALDARAGFDLARFVRKQFRVQNLFATMDRLRLPLFRHVASTVFTRMGAERARVDALMEAPFTSGAMPIHPGVLAHFRMAAPLPDHRYPVLDEGTFSFEQYCRRYLRYEWNEPLHTAMALAETDPGAAIAALRLALDVSPGSRAGQLALEEAERAVAESASQAPLVLTAPVSSDAATGSGAPMYAALDAPLPDGQASSSLMPGSLPKAASVVPERKADEAPVFAPSGFGRLPFTSEQPARAAEPEPLDEDPVPAPVQPPAPVFSARAALPEPVADDHGWQGDTGASVPAADELPDQQPYIELPLNQSGFGVPPEIAPIPATSSRYVQLPPSPELIEVLPRMLPNTRGLAETVDSPFSAMPETMPPPPLRPVLPPELHPEFDEKRGLVARLFGGNRH